MPSLGPSLEHDLATVAHALGVDLNSLPPVSLADTVGDLPPPQLGTPPFPLASLGTAEDQVSEALRRLQELADWFNALWVESGATPAWNLAQGTEATHTYLALEQNKAAILDAARSLTKPAPWRHTCSETCRSDTVQ